MARFGPDERATGSTHGPVDSLRVLIADDHAPTRLGVRDVLERAGFIVCAEVATGRAAVEAALREKPDLALLDVRMPGGGIEAAAVIAAHLPECAVVMLTVSRDDEDLFNALRAGARGYLVKDIDPERLAAALSGVLSGEAALPRDLVARLVEEFRGRERAPAAPREGALSRLSRREWEVLHEMREGYSTQEIAERLFVAPVTVRAHTAAILRKLKVPDRRTAISMFDGG